MHSKKDLELKELSEMILQLVENQRAMEREIGFLKDNLKAQNSLSKEMLKIHKIHRDLATKNTKQLGRIETLLRD
ncbi:MAG: hypothetical protein KAS60_04120 [Thermoplasmata archaeon]|nr:hypothetical protein [Candidatus Thermoplasmatota archaeon]MCK4949258.1 hypothetical protein [Thermoplasmata archaeon]